MVRRTNAREVQRGKILKRLRLERGFTQSALARKSRVDQSAISAYEGGRRSMSEVNAAKLAKALDVSIDDFSREAPRAAASTRAAAPRDEVIALRVYREAPEPVREAFQRREPPHDLDFFGWVDVLREEYEAYQQLAMARGDIEKIQALLDRRRGKLPSELTDGLSRLLAEYEQIAHLHIDAREKRRTRAPEGYVMKIDLPDLPDVTAVNVREADENGPDRPGSS